MTKKISLAEKVDLLLNTITRPNGQRYTYEEIERKTGIKASTISRIRRGENADPYFRTVIALGNAFGVRLGYFSTEMTRSEAESYLASPENTEFLDVLRHRQQQESDNERNALLDRISLRASYIDEEGLVAVADMLDYVLKQKGIRIDQESGDDIE